MKEPTDLLYLERLYSEATPAPWVNGNVYSAIVAPGGQPEPGYGGALIAESFRSSDRKLVIALHASFPDMTKELRAIRERIAKLEVVAYEARELLKCDYVTGPMSDTIGGAGCHIRGHIGDLSEALEKLK